MADALTVNQRPLQRLRSLGRALSEPKIHDKSMRAGYRRQLSKVTRNLKREVRGEGHREMARAVGSQLRAKRRSVGHDYSARVGIKRKNRKYSRIWHIVNLGPKPHGNNPGYPGKDMRDRAARPTREELDTAFWGSYQKTYEREIRRRA